MLNVNISNNYINLIIDIKILTKEKEYEKQNKGEKTEDTKIIS